MRRPILILAAAIAALSPLLAGPAHAGDDDIPAALGGIRPAYLYGLAQKREEALREELRRTEKALERERHRNAETRKAERRKKLHAEEARRAAWREQERRTREAKLERQRREAREAEAERRRERERDRHHRAGGGHRATPWGDDDRRRDGHRRGWDDDRRHARLAPIPASCHRTVIFDRTGPQHAFGGRCLARSYRDAYRLPNACRVPLPKGQGRAAYLAECLLRRGFTIGR
ncbi:hypothetical protein [Roseivivax marinus]|uniref:hypothetical protein n=1 Tax=Roseivivax marinus TaxID=1379903 RepID=UPI00273EDBA1|nr:hypothetical protein [Roseivivax marinus]